MANSVGSTEYRTGTHTLNIFLMVFFSDQIVPTDAYINLLLRRDYEPGQ